MSEEVNEVLKVPTFEIRRQVDGLGFGSGSISGELDEAHSRVIDETIEQSPDLLVAVGVDDLGIAIDDDGCGDGRGVDAIFRAGAELKRSLDRAKVFGGGLTMTTATLIGRGQATGKSLSSVFSVARHTLGEKGIEFGAHTDVHAEGTNCGCGAIDKAPVVIRNVVNFEPEIRATIDALGIPTEGLDAVIDNYKTYADEIEGQSFSGSDIMRDILNDGKVVKRLGGVHNERRIILNTVEGTTVNQRLIRDISHDEAQVFVTDIWRLSQIAQKLYPADQAAQQAAFLSQVVYTLGVAGTLTKGDLPVYVISGQPAYSA